MDRLISEQAVLDLIADYDLSMGQVVKGIHALPSVNPQEPIIDKIRAKIDVARFIDKDTKLCKNANASGLEVAMQIIDKYKAESEES